MLQTRDQVRDAIIFADQLDASYQDATGAAWTDEVFRRLSSFAQEHLQVPQSGCFHKRHLQGNTEFLWDFIALDAQNRVLLAAESEQSSKGERSLRRLKHDFEKLFYVYSPLRVLVCKAEDSNHVEKLVEELQTFSSVVDFNPGAAFLLHFYLWSDRGAITYLWQDEREPVPQASRRLNFLPL